MTTNLISWDIVKAYQQVKHYHLSPWLFITADSKYGGLQIHCGKDQLFLNNSVVTA